MSKKVSVDLDRLRLLAAQGMTLTQMGRELGATKMATYYYLVSRQIAWKRVGPGRGKGTPRDARQRAYVQHMENARNRGITWEFSFDTWWEVWDKSGKWNLRGNKSDQYVMARFGDSGAYSPGNVRIATKRENCQEANHRGPKAAKGVRLMFPGRVNGWEARINGRRLGFFPSEQEARAARASAEKI